MRFPGWLPQELSWFAMWGNTRCGWLSILLLIHRLVILSSSGLGTMGYGLPAAIGAQLSNPRRWWWNVSGDGSFMMNLQAGYHPAISAAVKIIVLDNQYLGMVRQKQQELFYKQRYSEVDLSDNPEFTEVARLLG